MASRMAQRVQATATPPLKSPLPHSLPKLSRRSLLATVPAAPLLFAQPGPATAAFGFGGSGFGFGGGSSTAAPIIDQPMRRIRLPKGGAGRDFVLIRLRIGNAGPFDFMVDSGLTAELISPHLQQVLGIRGSGQRLTQGLGAGGSVNGGQLVTLNNAALLGAPNSRSGDLPLPPLTAVVQSFVQEHLDPEHDPVEGMLGMEVLEMFDADFDFPGGRIRLWAPGDGAAAATAAGLVEVPAAVLNETGLLGIRATSPQGNTAQPFVGIIDCGASFSALNWEAAALAGLPPRGDRSYSRNQSIYGVGVDGKPQPLPTAQVQLTFAGDARTSGLQNTGNGFGRGSSGQQLVAFSPPPRDWRPWDPIMAAVGDLPVFSQLLGDGRTPFKGPAALIGLDVLAQRRVVLGAGKGQPGRQRRLFVSKR